MQCNPNITVLLIRTKPDPETIGLQHVMLCEPLELEYIAANVSGEGVIVHIVDMMLESKPLAYFIKKYQPDYVGLSGYVTHVHIIKQTAAEIKLHKYDCKVIVGGVYAEVVPEDFIDDNVDFIAENGIVDFQNILKSTSNKLYDSTLTNLNHPDRRSTEHYRKHYYYMFHNPCALIKTSYGCPYKCSFCFCRKITNDYYIERDLQDVIEELQTIEEQEIYIVDDNFLVSAERVLQFCQLLAAANLDKKFLIYGRADFISANEYVIKTFKAHGLQAVIVGLESCREQDLQDFNKQTDISINEQAAAILKKYDVDLYGTVILGMDYTATDFNNLGAWLKKIDVTFVNLQPLTPLYGTDIFSEYEDKITVERTDYAKWDLAHLVMQPHFLTAPTYYWQMIKLYYKITIRPATVIKLIKKYGLIQVLKLSIGSSKVTWQYLKKIITK